MDEHDWKLGDRDVFDFLYGTGMSALDSAASAAAGNLVGGALANTGAGIKAAGKVAEAVGGGIYGVCSDMKGVPLPILNLIRVTAEHSSVIAKPSCP